MFVPAEVLYKTPKYLALKAVLAAEERFHFCFVCEITCFTLLEKHENRHLTERRDERQDFTHC